MSVEKVSRSLKKIGGGGHIHTYTYKMDTNTDSVHITPAHACVCRVRSGFTWNLPELTPESSYKL